MENDGQAFIYHRFIAPSGATVNFAKALNRSVTGSMNDLLRHAEHWLADEEISPHDLGLFAAWENFRYGQRIAATKIEPASSR